MKTLHLALLILLGLSLISGSVKGTDIINLVLNPGAELGYDIPMNWVSTGSALWTTGGHSGLHCFGLEDSGSWTSDPIIIDPERFYNFSFWVKGTWTSGNIFVHLRQWSEANGTGWIDQWNFLLNSDFADWTFVKEDNIQFASNAQSITVCFCNDDVSIGHFYVDDLHLSDVLDVPWYEEIFTELLFGSGSWIGLILIVVLLLVIGFINKYGGMVSLPIAVLLFIEYTVQGLGWHGIIVFLVGMIGILNSSYQLKSKK